MKLPLSYLFRIICILLIVSVLFGIGLYRLEINSDVVDSLPKNDPIISDAMQILKNHPFQDQLIIDVGHQKADLDLLVDYGRQVEKKLKASGLFRSVGFEDFQGWIPGLASLVLNNLPAMFSEKELNETIKPTLTANEINRSLNEIRQRLASIEGIGQAESMLKDPLDWRGTVLARLAPLSPAQNARWYKGNLFSADDRHLLILASPLFSGTDTVQSRKLVSLMQQIGNDLKQKATEAGDAVTLTPVGAYRGALDNELIIRKDVKNALLFSTIGIVLLLIFAFPRPYLGLLSLLPAIAGTMMAFFVFSLLHRSISIIVLGFGGTIISISVDEAIAYLLFLDRPQRTYGKEVSHEIWSVGLLGGLTTVGAYMTLLFSGFPIFEQLGLFTALGVSFSFLFIHFVFPMIFHEMPPAQPKKLPLQTLVNSLAATGKKGFYLAFAFFGVMLFFAKPDFAVNLNAMNTVSRDTLAAEKLVTDVWGHAFNRIFVMTEADSLPDLQKKGDRLLEIIENEIPPNTFSSGFVSSLIFPGEDRQNDNLAAWKKFWNPQKISEVRQTLTSAAVQLGFKADAFEPFFKILLKDTLNRDELNIPQAFYGPFGIKKNPDRAGWVQVSTFMTTGSYQPEKILNKFQSIGKIFDPNFFSNQLGKLLFATFLKLLIIIAASVFILLLLFFFDLKLTIISLLPIVFAFVSTLGTLKIIGHPLDITGLILAVVVVGMGIDFSLFFVRSYKKYVSPLHPSFMLVRMAIFMDVGSSLIGFGVLCTAEHSVLRSAGLTLTLGIGYAFIGTFVIIPPIFEYLSRVNKKPVERTGKIQDRVISRYGSTEAYPRVFARFKMRLDPMFAELPALIESERAPGTIMDIGCGYGVPACWLLERFPQAMVYGIDPDPERVRVAAMAVGENGLIAPGRAPDIPKVPQPADLVMMLDMIHYLNDDELRLTLQRLNGALAQNGRLIIRAALPPKGRLARARAWCFENLKYKISKIQCHYRSLDEVATIIISCGFKIERFVPSGIKGDLVWVEVQPLEDIVK